LVGPTLTYATKFYLREWIVEDLGVIIPNLVKSNTRQINNIIQQLEQTIMDVNAMFTINYDTISIKRQTLYFQAPLQTWIPSMQKMNDYDHMAYIEEI
jgi:hypothetical protein